VDDSMGQLIAPHRANKTTTRRDRLTGAAAGAIIGVLIAIALFSVSGGYWCLVAIPVCSWLGYLLVSTVRLHLPKVFW